MPLGSDPRPGNQEVRGAGESPCSFSTEPLFLIPSGPRPVLAMQSGDRDRRESPHFVFEGTTFTRSFPARLAPRKPGDRARRGAPLFSWEPLSLIPSGWERSPRSGSPGGTALCFKGTTFPHSLCFTDAVGRTRLPPAVLPLALRRKEIAEFWQYGKRTRRCSDSFRQHPDAILTKVAEETAPLREVPNS